MHYLRRTKRAMRRHHRERLKAKRRNHWGRDLRDNPAVLGMVVNTPTPCSCSMCCNIRRNQFLSKYEKLTVQEKRAVLDKTFDN